MADMTATSVPVEPMPFSENAATTRSRRSDDVQSGGVWRRMNSVRPHDNRPSTKDLETADLGLRRRCQRVTVQVRQERRTAIENPDDFVLEQVGDRNPVA